jgi:signal transduction histidine kinase
MTTARSEPTITSHSIQIRLLAIGFALSVLFLVITGLVLSNYYRNAAEKLFDNNIKITAIALIADVVSFVEDPNAIPGNLGDTRYSNALSGWYWQILKLSGATGDSATGRPETLFASRSLAGAELPLLDKTAQSAGRPRERSGFITGPDGRRLRLLEQQINLDTDGIFIVAVAGDVSEIEDQKRSFDLSIIVAFTALGLALGLATLLQVRFGLQPLRRLIQSISAIRQGETERLVGAYPVEIAPVATEINLLLDANREIVERSRTQVGNLAHALKTPLSVLTAEAELSKGQLAEKVSEQSALMRDQVQHYLDRARVAARAVTSASETDVEEVVSSFIRTFAKINRDRNTVFSGHVAKGLKFRGEKQDLEEMIGNLVDNAGKWAKSKVVVSALAVPDKAGGRARLQILIDDDGPGLAPELRAEALKRGRRLDETKPGSGLGLSIVVDMAALYGGTLSLDRSPDGGLRAGLELPSF